MRRYIVPVLALSLAAMPAAAAAQTPRAQHGMHAGAAAGGGAMLNPAARVLLHRDALGLSLDQVRQLQQIQARTEQQNQPLLDQLQAAAPGMGRGMAQQARQLPQMTPEQREAMRTQMQERRGQMTPEQRAGMQAQMQERRAGMQAQMQERRGQMTPEQREAMQAQMQERRAGMQAQMQERRARMTPEQRAGMQAQMQERRAGFEALRPVREQLQANHQQAREEVQAVLTSQQQEQLRQLQQGRAQEMRQRMQGMREGGANRPAGAGRMQRRDG
jgi:periplasmic protein CpxP/Spy